MPQSLVRRVVREVSPERDPDWRECPGASRPDWLSATRSLGSMLLGSAYKADVSDSSTGRLLHMVSHI